MAYEGLGWPLNLISEINHKPTTNVFVNAYQLEQCIGEMYGRYYDILIGHYKNGESFKKIAEKLEISDSRVGEIRNHGLRKLNRKEFRNRYLGVSGEEYELLAKKASLAISDNIGTEETIVITPFIDHDISWLELGVRTYNGLARMGVKTVRDIGELGLSGAEIETRLALTKGFGPKMINELKDRLEKVGYSLDILALEVNRDE